MLKNRNALTPDRNFDEKFSNWWRLIKVRFWQMLSQLINDIQIYLEPKKNMKLEWISIISERMQLSFSNFVLGWWPLGFQTNISNYFHAIKVTKLNGEFNILFQYWNCSNTIWLFDKQIHLTHNRQIMPEVDRD